MQNFNRTASIGALLMSLALVGYALYQLVLYPYGGFPTQDFALISVAGLVTTSLPRSVCLPGILLGALFALDFVMPYPLSLIAPLLGIAWAFWAGLVLWRESAGAMALRAAEA